MGKQQRSGIFTRQYFHITRNIEMIDMHLPDAAAALSALALPHRLAVFRLLVKAGPEGLPAGGIASEIGVANSTLSTHLAILGRARLIRSRRAGRSIVYSADYERMRALLAFLVTDCCGGRPEICGSLAALADQCCDQ